MKKKKVALLLLSVIALVLVFVAACKKDRVPQDDYQNMDSFYNDNQEPEQELQIDSGGSCPVVVPLQKTRLCVSRDMFQDAAGNVIPSYPFNLKVIELYTIKQMILRKAPSTSGGAILQTSAEVKVRPFKDGNEAYLRPGRKYGMETGGSMTTTNSMQSYYGFDNGGTIDWTNSIASLIPGFVDTLSTVTTQPTYYALTPATSGYVSAAQPHASSAQLTTITLTVAGTNTQNIQVYISFRNFKGVMRVTNLVSAQIPVGEQVTLVAFAKKQTSEFVLHQQTFVVTAGMQIALNMQVISQADLLAALAAL